MYLARAFLNPVSRAVRADLADPASLHRTVMRLFPNDADSTPRRANGALHRVDEDARRGRFVLLVQSATRPSFERIDAGYFLDLGDDLDGGASLSNPSVRSIAEERSRIAAGDVFVFRLRANTTKKVTKIAEGTTTPTKNGQRVPLRDDEARLAWLSRHAQAGGFQVAADVRVVEMPPVKGRDRGLSFAGATFDGRLRVTDADLFRAALVAGIGPAKAFGFGLLTIRRVDAEP